MDKLTKDIADDIRAAFGPVGVLYADQLAQYLGRSTKAIYELWESLPVPVVQVGGRPAVTVLAVASWLACGRPKRKEISGTTSPKVPEPKRRREQLEILARGVVSQRDFLAQFHAELERELLASDSSQSHTVSDTTDEDHRL